MAIEAVQGMFGEPTGQGWTQVGELGAAFVLSAIIGLERELKQKAAGLRTYTIVGFGAALFMLVSKYGFTDVLESGQIVLDPSRVAAQIVSGLGFIGGGIIFVKRDSVRGLTTAASIWLTAAVGSAAGAGLLVLAAIATGAYLLVALVLPVFARFAARITGNGRPLVRVSYVDGRGLLRDVLSLITDSGFQIADMATTRTRRSDPDSTDESVEVVVHLNGRGNLQSVLTELSELDGVLAVATDEESEPY
ncbi:MAG TPA: MgtC/SapB family protein [Pseudonocardiaceae bacterium]|jgi:putative Mg2+ transporter-C (MgtC) family protein|nr:MgtC/SapB family protein [Pseudonocardiaceae bacterium]